MTRICSQLFGSLLLYKFFDDNLYEIIKIDIYFKHNRFFSVKSRMFMTQKPTVTKSGYFW